MLRKSLWGIPGIVIVCSIAVFAQGSQLQTPAAQDDALQRERNERMERRRERLDRRQGIGRENGRGWRGHGIGHFASELNLTEEQQQQTRAIAQRRLEGLRAQREEFFKLHEKRVAGTFTAEDAARAKELRQQIRSGMEGFENDFSGILTPDQESKLEQLKKERKEKREQRIRERQERRKENPL